MIRYECALDTGIKILADYGNVEEAYGMSPAELCEKIKDFDALIIRSATQVYMQPEPAPACFARYALPQQGKKHLRTLESAVIFGACR